MARLIGKQAKVYYGTAGNAANTELTIVREVSDNCNVEEVDLTARGEAFKNTGVSRAEVAFDLTLLVDEADAGFTALKGAFVNGTTVALYVRSTNTGLGWDYDAVVSKFSRREPYQGEQLVEVSTKANTTTRNPSYH